MGAAMMGMKPMNAMAAMNFRFTEITVPGGITPGVFGINNHGTIVGNYCLPDSPNVVRGFLWRHWRYTQIDYPGALGTGCSGINDEGQIVGWYVDALQNTHGFLLDEDGFRTLDVPGAGSTFALGINNRGQIVGRYVDGAQVQHGFLLSHGVYTTVDFPGQTGNELYGINDHGEMVGNYNYESNAFIVTSDRHEDEEAGRQRPPVGSRPHLPARWTPWCGPPNAEIKLVQQETLRLGRGVFLIVMLVKAPYAARCQNRVLVGTQRHCPMPP